MVGLLNPNLFAAATSTYSAEVLADGPLAYYRLGEASGTTINDSSGNSHNGTYDASRITLGVAGLVTGDSDTCVDFTLAGSGSSAPGAISGASWMNVANITLEAIINSDSVNANRSILDRDNLALTRCWQFRINSSGKIEFVYWTTTAGVFVLAGSTTLSVSTKYHVAATYDGTNAKVWLNGTQDGTQAQSGSLQVGTGVDLSIGASRSGGGGGLVQFFDGRIDEVAYYNTALSSTRIAAHAALR